MQSCKIKVSHVSKVFSHVNKVALDDVSFTFTSGQTIGMIGENGAGKSTLLSILAGISKQTQGTVDITGKVTAVMTIGIGLREDLTGRDNIYLDGEIQGKSRQDIDLLMDEIIAFAELDDFIDKPVKTYSTGMKSRLAFAMLVGIEPEILIIDEALSAGDVFFADKATRKIKEICEKGKIVIIVSHSMPTIVAMCNRCLWLEKGKIVMDGCPEPVTQAYLEKVRKVERDPSQYVFFTGDNIVVDIEIDRSMLEGTKLEWCIERLDGLSVSQGVVDINLEQLKAEASFIFQLSLDHSVLNKGYYQLKVMDKVIRSFEVKNTHVFNGGAPLLHYPAEITLC